MSAVQRLLVGAVLNVEVRVAAIPTLPFCDSFCANVAEAEVDSLVKSSASIMTTVTTVTVLRRLGSIFTSVYAAVQKLKKALEGLQGGKRLLYAKRNKAISLGKGVSKVSREVHSLFLKGLYLIRNLDPPAGLFVNHIRSSFDCDFVSLDSRIKSRKYTIDKSFTLGSTKAADNVNILQSCNGLLLCTETKNRQLTHYKLNIKDHEHPIITTIQIPQGLQQGRNFLESYGIMLPMIMAIQIPYMLHLEGKLFESRRCLLLVRRDYISSSEFTIYGMRKGCSVWSIKYLVDIDNFITPHPEG
ncbi:hypothetical protein Tco_0155359 [Tanacetum coccineum]